MILRRSFEDRQDSIARLPAAEAGGMTSGRCSDIRCGFGLGCPTAANIGRPSRHRLSPSPRRFRRACYM